MNIFYEPAINRNEKQILLNEQEADHALKVLRYKVGDDLKLIDGRGNFYDTQVQSIVKKQCWLKVLNFHAEKSNRPYRHLIIPPLKNRNRMEWMVEKAVEMGVQAISLVKFEHVERSRVNHDRVKRLLVSAMKQSMRATLPRYQVFESLDECLSSVEDADQRLIAECQTPGKSALGEIYQPSQSVHFIFGPEGDFASQELSLARDKGFQPVSLGSLRLRAETAPIAAMAMLEAIDQQEKPQGSNFAS